MLLSIPRRGAPSFWGFLFFITLFSAPSAFSLSELFELYTPPQVEAMGNAIVADASGYLANYYNPAGLAKAVKKKWEFIPIAVEGIFSFGAISQAISTRTLGAYQISQSLGSSPGTYAFF